MRYLLPLLFCLLLFDVRVANAQTCSGSLGDPIVNIDFGTGSSSYGPALSGGITNYPYIAAFPQDGQYTITNNTSVLNHNTWWSTNDHTPNSGGRGYMMVVNANATTTSYFYKQTISGLCPNTTYEFGAWIMNLATAPVPSKPNITFQIANTSGVVLSTYNTSDILESGSAKWQQYATLFTTSATSGDIVLTMINNGPGGNGNDIALDDITFRPCGPVLTPVFTTTNQPSLEGCASSTAQSFTMAVNDNGTSYTLPRYQWEVDKNDGAGWAAIPGALNKNYTAIIPANSGALVYKYRMGTADGSNIASTNCRVYSSPLTLTIHALPITPAVTDITVCEDTPIALNPAPDPATGNTYSWTGPNGYTSGAPDPVITSAKPTDAGTYQVTITNSFGCTSSATIRVKVNPKVVLTIANNNVRICEGDRGQLQVTAAGGSAFTYTWSPANTLYDPVRGSSRDGSTLPNPAAGPKDNTTYTVTVTNEFGCGTTATVNVTVIKKPVVNAGADRIITEGQSITLNGSVDDPTATYFWTPTTGLSNPNILHPIATPTEDITYTLHAQTGLPCNFENADAVFVRVYKKVVVPNAFTPNNDGVNDTWGITALFTYPESLTQVFNRYGKLVFQSQGYTQPWDGKQNGRPVPEGTYYYKIDLKNGTVLSGWVAVLR